MTQYHESAKLHVTGTATYIDDIKINPSPLHGYAYTSPVAKGIIKKFDFSDALKVKGVHAILSHKDIKGAKKIGAVMHDEPVLVENEINYIGQALFLIAAETEEAFLEAQKLIKVEIEEQKPVITIDEARKLGLSLEQRKIERGNIDEGFKKSDYIIEGTTKTGAQEQWYLETQVAVAVPGEGEEMKIYSSTQHPGEVQLHIAAVLNVSANNIEVETRRMGGAFGGKETQAGTFAVWAALLANATGMPVKVRLERFIDQQITGKRHPFENHFKVGFDKNGKITALDVELNANGGAYADLSMAILERAMFHTDNAYFLPNVRIIGNVWLTNIPPNTAFRGFGGPQGVFNIEHIIEKIARKLGKQPWEIQYLNFYKEKTENITPYGQKVENNHLYRIWEQIMQSSDFQRRKKEVDDFNKQNKYTKHGIALTPVKFGISFTATFLNQAGALVTIYTDGTVLVNHGGTEMGQGLHTKMQKIAAAELGIDISKVKVNATNTSKVPNASATAASTGSDLNGMAVKNAIDKIKKNIAEVVANEIDTNVENIIFENNFIFDKNNPDKKISFDEATTLAWLKMKSLAAYGFYATPGIYMDWNSGQGKPFYYFAYGMSITEVEVDLLTGNVQLLRADILHDVGDPINKDIDKGQIEGAYIQGVGWALSEDQKWNTAGQNITPSPDTYKIPAISDIPKDFRVNLLEDVPHPPTIRRSKAVGEPPFIHGLSAWFAVKDALWAITNYKVEPKLNFPATNEYIVVESERLLDQ